MFIRRATLPDVSLIGPRVREFDRKEGEALLGKPFEAGLLETYKHSTHAYVAVDRGPIALFGLQLVKATGVWGIPWFVATADVNKRPRDMLKYGRAMAAHFARFTPNMMNLVHAENHGSFRWLPAIGFEIDFSYTAIINGEPFHAFYRRAHVPR